MCSPVSGSPARARIEAAAGAARGDAEAVASVAIGWDEPQADARPRRGDRGEPGDLAHLLGAVGDDGRALVEGAAQLGGAS